MPNTFADCFPSADNGINTTTKFSTCESNGSVIKEPYQVCSSNDLRKECYRRGIKIIKKGPDATYTKKSFIELLRKYDRGEYVHPVVKTPTDNQSLKKTSKPLVTTAMTTTKNQKKSIAPQDISPPGRNIASNTNIGSIQAENTTSKLSIGSRVRLINVMIHPKTQAIAKSFHGGAEIDDKFWQYVNKEFMSSLQTYCDLKFKDPSFHGIYPFYITSYTLIQLRTAWENMVQMYQKACSHCQQAQFTMQEYFVHCSGREEVLYLHYALGQMPALIEVYRSILSSPNLPDVIPVQDAFMLLEGDYQLQMQPAKQERIITRPPSNEIKRKERILPSNIQSSNSGSTVVHVIPADTSNKQCNTKATQSDTTTIASTSTRNNLTVEVLEKIVSMFEVSLQNSHNKRRRTSSDMDAMTRWDFLLQRLEAVEEQLERLDLKKNKLPNIEQDIAFYQKLKKKIQTQLVQVE
jgi:hypothetical protein